RSAILPTPEHPRRACSLKAPRRRWRDLWRRGFAGAAKPNYMPEQVPATSNSELGVLAAWTWTFSPARNRPVRTIHPRANWEPTRSILARVAVPAGLAFECCDLRVTAIKFGFAQT